MGDESQSGQPRGASGARGQGASGLGTGLLPALPPSPNTHKSHRHVYAHTHWENQHNFGPEGGGKACQALALGSESGPGQLHFGVVCGERKQGGKQAWHRGTQLSYRHPWMLGIWGRG